MNILFLKGFNNYYNRIVKKYSTLNDYKENSSTFIDLSSINFNPNDNVATELIIGNENQKENNLPLNWENNGVPDYAICYEMEGQPAAAVIKSRWFVLESERTRSGQYRLALKRDVVAEEFDKVIEAPCFVEKGWINDINNSLLYNKESMTYNQIKTAEYPLKDDTNVAWIVGYISKNAPQASSTISTEVLLEGDPSDYFIPADLPFDISVSEDTGDPLTESLNLYSSSQLQNNSGCKLFLTLAGIGFETLQSRYAHIYTGMTYFDTNSNKGQYNLSYIETNNYNFNTDPIPTLQSTGKYKNNISNYTVIQNNQTIFKLTADPSETRTFLVNRITGTSSGGILAGTNSSYFVNGFLNTPSDTTVYALNNNVKNELESFGHIIVDTTDTFLTTYNNKFIKINDKFYKMEINPTGKYRFDVWRPTNNTTVSDYGSNTVVYHELSGTVAGAAVFVVNSIKTKSTKDSTEYLTIGGNPISVVAQSIGYTVTFTPVLTETLSVEVPAYNNRSKCYDSCADIFAIPYGSFKFKTGLALHNSVYTTTKERGLALARALAEEYGENVCFDLQLVPYCPSDTIRNMMVNQSRLLLPLLNPKTYKIAYINDGEGNTTPATFFLWVSSCKGEFDINISDTDLLNSLYPSTNVDVTMSDSLKYKILNETINCRLASPNFNGMFEFSPVKNKSLKKFNVDYTYKPYSPYIHINPDFGGLYGTDWNDARGLICGGDFSLSYNSSYWKTYQNNNKNYQQIFDRQIQNMDVNNSIALEKQNFQATVGTITSAVNGTIGGAVSGATAGAVAGPIGAIIGGIAGAIGGGVGMGAASAYGAQKDLDWLQRQQAEARSFATDMYGYQLGNIQAMPYSLARTESLTNNNKIWPTLEIYTATTVENDALINKLRFNGMTVMAIGKINDYRKEYIEKDFDLVYIKGQLLRLDTINDDFHIANAIYEEVNKGLYLAPLRETVLSE